MELTRELGPGRVSLHATEPARAVAVVVTTLEGEQLLIGSDAKRFPVRVGDTVFWCVFCENIAGTECQSHRTHFLLARVVAVA